MNTPGGGIVSDGMFDSDPDIPSIMIGDGAGGSVSLLLPLFYSLLLSTLPFPPTFLFSLTKYRY